jgi:hypothetical protein
MQRTPSTTEPFSRNFLDETCGLVIFQGGFVWHKHDHEDELFLDRDRHVWLEVGELLCPRGGTSPSCR